MKKLLVLILASLACYSEPLVFVTGGGSGGGSGAVDSVNGKTGTVVLSGTDIKVTETSTTNIAVHLANKVDRQYTSADDNKVLTIDPTDHKVKPMPSSASSVSFLSVVPSSTATIASGTRGFLIASRGTKSLIFTYDSVGQSIPLDNTDGEISIQKSPDNELLVTGTSTAAYSITLIKE